MSNLNWCKDCGCGTGHSFDCPRNLKPKKYTHGASNTLQALRYDMPDFINLMYRRRDLHLVMHTADVVDTAVRWNI